MPWMTTGVRPPTRGRRRRPSPSPQAGEPCRPLRGAATRRGHVGPELLDQRGQLPGLLDGNLVPAVEQLEPGTPDRGDDALRQGLRRKDRIVAAPDDQRRYRQPGEAIG